MLTKQTLQSLANRHWKGITLSQANGLRELFVRLETETESERIIKRAFARIRNRGKSPSRSGASVYASNRDDDGRGTVTVTDAFDRNHSIIL